MRFETLINDGGVQGILTRLFAARLLGRIYEDELRMLADHAKAHPPLS